MTTQTEALKALVHEMEYVLSCINAQKVPFDGDDFHEALRLGKEALAQPEQEEKLHPVHIGVDVTKEGTAVTAFYRKPDDVMEMFYSQFHPLAQPEQERCVGCEACINTACGRDECPKGWPKAAQPEQEQNLKLMPREATPEMLKAMDECSTEGYDERLYEGHAGSVYMAAWDAFHGQHCYCGDITNLGVIHRDDGPCHYPEHTSEYKRGYADAMNWKVQNHLEHLQPKVRTGDCLLTGVCASEGHKIAPQRTWVGLTDEETAELVHRYAFYELTRQIEAKLKEKNT